VSTCFTFVAFEGVVFANLGCFNGVLRPVIFWFLLELTLLAVVSSVHYWSRREKEKHWV